MFVILVVFLKEFLQKVYFEKKISRRQNAVGSLVTDGHSEVKSTRYL